MKSLNHRPILILDIETNSLNIDDAKLKWFGAYSYLDMKYHLIPFKGNEKDVKNLIRRHKVIVSFNGKTFDNPIIKNNLNDDNVFDYKTQVDLLEMSAPKAKGYGENNKNRLANMGIKLKSFSLKNIIEKLKLDEDGTKGDIDYKIFQKDDWTSEEIIEIKKYLKQDIELTKKLFIWYENAFAPLKQYLSIKDRESFLYLKSSLAVLAYNIICYKAGLKVEFGEKDPNKKPYAGGHHIEPRQDLVKGNIISIDVVSMYPMMIMMGNLCSNIGITEDGWDGDDFYTLDGKYDNKTQGKVELALKDIFLERLKAKKTGDKVKNLAYKIVINCFSEDSYIMTVKGLKKIKYCKIGDLVYSLNIKNGETEIKPITEVMSQKYNGEMHHYTSNVTDLMVTPDHKILVNKRKKDGSMSNIKIIESKKFKPNGIFPNSKPINGLKVEHINISNSDSVWSVKLKNPYLTINRYDTNLKYDGNTRRHISMQGRDKHEGEWFFHNRGRDMWIKEKLSIKDFMYFVGCFIADGCSYIIKPSDEFKVKRGTTYTVNISKYKNIYPKVYKKIEDVIIKLGFRYSKNSKGFRICSKTLYDYLIKIKQNSENISIPDEYFEYDHIILKSLYDGMFDCDGTKSTNGSKYSTKSESLKNDVIKLNLHLGYNSNFSSDSGINRIIRKNNRWYKNKKVIKNPTNNIYSVTVKDNHTVLAGREGKLQWTGQSFYGTLGNPIFKTIYNRNSASDTTSMARTVLKKTCKYLDLCGFEILSGFTDSIYVRVPDGLTKEDLMFYVNKYIEEVKSHVPFPTKEFKMDIEEEMKMIWFVAKNCYLYVTDKDEVKYKSTLLNTNTPKGVIKLFNEYMKPIIIDKLEIPFKKKELEKQMKSLIEKEIELAAQEYKVNDKETYKVQSSIQYQISEKYGQGRHFLIPNKKGIGIGKEKNTKKRLGIRHCSIQEFKDKGLKINDIDLKHLLGHLKAFYKRNEVKFDKSEQVTL